MDCNWASREGAAAKHPVHGQHPFPWHRLKEMDPLADRPRETGWRADLHRIIFGVNTRKGRAFDIVLLWAILLSVAAVLFESVPTIQAQHGTLLRVAEWIFTVLFTIEYGLRLWTVQHPKTYALSFFGIVDLLAILPSYLSALISGSQSLSVVRAIRLLRVFRVLKLVRHMREAQGLMGALRASRPKIVVFLTGVLSIAVIFGTIMYLVEGDRAGFTSIPTSIYWAVVTMTTVGYGDIAPQTPIGQFLALVLMILGYAIIAVPTGIVSAEITRAERAASTLTCPTCSRTGHQPRAKYCYDCGSELLELDQQALRTRPRY